MTRMTLRIPNEKHEKIKFQSLIENQSMNSILLRAVDLYLDTLAVGDLNEVQRAVTNARALGRRSQEEAFRMAERAAKLDDAEGLGELHVDALGSTG